LPLMIAAQGLLRLSQRRIAQVQEVLGRRSSSKAGGEVCAFESRRGSKLVFRARAPDNRSGEKADHEKRSE
jgi:hypothetical protein